MSQNVETLVSDVLSEHGISTAARVEEAVQQPSFEAYTDRRTHQTTFRYDPHFQLPDSASRFLRRKNVQQPLEVCVRDIIGHECGHIPNRRRRACPGTIIEHVEHFYAPIAGILQHKLGAVDSITNLVEDLIDNTLQQQHTGLSLFYKDVASTIGWSPLYEAYMRIQLYAWGDKEDKQFLTTHFTNNPQITEAAQKFLRAIEAHNSGKRFSHEQIARYFAEQGNWKTVAVAFTQALEPLIPQHPAIPMCGFGKRMQQEMQDPTTREKFARRNYTQGRPKPDWMSIVDALDAVYSSLAREIQVRVEAPRKGMSLPLVPYQHEPFHPEEHSPAQINFRKPIIVPEQETPFSIPGLSFGVPQRYIERPVMVKKGITNFPDLKASYLDCSVSMKEGIPDHADSGSSIFIPWGDKSKYHYLCTAWYGIIEYLARQQILPNVQITLGAFSSSSRVSHGLEAAKETLFSPQWGETEIDPAALNKLFSGGKSVFFTVSDGDVQNWNEVGQGFIAQAKEHYYFHIQLGPHTAMSRSLKCAGLPVYTVRTGQELEQMAVDLTRNAYQTYIDEALEHAS